MKMDQCTIDAHAWRMYVVGFVLSLILTFGAYLLIVTPWLTGWVLLIALAALAVVQAAVQLVFFLHIGQDALPHWKMIVFIFTVIVVGILVAGSLWIMYNLDMRTMEMG